MGMAASQARYLGLTARKTNVEYEGQQVNQARTALANQSANLFNQLLTLQVPQAPSTADFTTIQYSYKAGTTDEVIESMTKIDDPDYNYSVTHYHFSDFYKGFQYKVTNPQVSRRDGKWNIATHELTKYVPGENKDLDAAYKQINEDQGGVLEGKVVYFYKNLNDDRTYFATEPDLQKSLDSSGGMVENQDPLMTYYAETTKDKVKKTERAIVEMGTDGRAKTIKYESDSQVYTLNSESITDEAAYQDAMNKYVYDKDVYEKQIQDINAKTERIQQEDRTLELRLRQLDTEQEALQTEMEAVKKVIDKNIESTFKTFE